jgi:hypothetical protein
MSKTFIIIHVMNPNASIDSDSDHQFIGPFYTRKEAAEYLADPVNNVVEYLEPNEHSRVPYVQTSDWGRAEWQNTSRRQLVQRAMRDKEGFSYTAFGDFMKIVEVEKRK